MTTCTWEAKAETLPWEIVRCTPGPQPVLAPVPWPLPSPGNAHGSLPSHRQSNLLVTMQYKAYPQRGTWPHCQAGRIPDCDSNNKPSWGVVRDAKLANEVVGNGEENSSSQIVKHNRRKCNTTKLQCPYIAAIANRPIRPLANKYIRIKHHTNKKWYVLCNLKRIVVTAFLAITNGMSLDSIQPFSWIWGSIAFTLGRKKSAISLNAQVGGCGCWLHSVRLAVFHSSGTHRMWRVTSYSLY